LCSSNFSCRIWVSVQDLAGVDSIVRYSGKVSNTS
jgi:hypothetical protein